MDGQTHDPRAQGRQGRALNHTGLLAALLVGCLASACQGRAGDTPAPASAAPVTAPAPASPDGASTPAPDLPDSAPASEPASVPKSPPLIDGTPSDRPVPFLPPEGKPRADMATPGRLVLNQGMKAEIGPGATLSFDSVVSDSRCPQGVQCVWAGEVTIAMTLVTPLGSKSFELSDRSNRQAALAYVVEMASFGACPGGPAVTPLPGECATLTVSADPAP